LTGTLGLLSVLGEHLPSDSSVLIFGSTHLLPRPVGHDDIIMDFSTDMFEQAMKQAMINWTNSLANTTNNTVKGVDARKIVHQFNYHTSKPMIFQHQTSAQTCGYQYYASAPQPMACQQPWLTVQQPQPMVQQPRPMVYQFQWAASYQLQMLTPSLMSYQPQQSGGYQPQASAYQSMSCQPSMAIPQQSYYYPPQMSICQTIYQPQQLSVQQPMAESPIIQYPIVQQLQPDSCQPIMQQSEPIIHQQCIANSQDGEFESKVLVSGVSR